MSEALPPTVDRTVVTEIAELAVRRYFDHYLDEVWPQQETRIVESIKAAVTAHDQDPASHTGVARRFDRFFWTLAGLSLGSGVGIGTISTLLLKAAQGGTPLGP